MAYDVLLRIASGLDIPRSWIGLAYHEDAASTDPTVGRRSSTRT